MSYTKQDEWLRITEKARWYELPQRSIGLGAVLGLTVACLGLLIMFIQFFLAGAGMPILVFWWGLSAFLCGTTLFAYSERAQVMRNQWRPQRDYLVEQRNKSHRCMHLEGEMPTHLRDTKQAHCQYYDKTFQHAPLCVYCESYSPAIAPATPPEGLPSLQPAAAQAFAVEGGGAATMTQGPGQ
ncbi:MAG: hypothetical protein ABI743_02870 [bacterium]